MVDEVPWASTVVPWGIDAMRATVTPSAGVGEVKQDHEPTDALRRFWQREEELIKAGDIAGAVELNVATWLGPEADRAIRDRVRLMQRHAFEVQLAAPEEYEPAEVAVDLGAITAPSLVVAGPRTCRISGSSPPG